MEILTDLHCHTVASTHAFSTVYENIEFAKRAGLEALAITDHSLRLPDSPHLYHFECMRMIPKEVDGLRVFKGIELNILNRLGDTDMDEFVLKSLDMTVASIHKPCYKHTGEEDHTETYLNALNNPYITILGHTDSADLKYDLDAVLTKAKEKNVLIEINNNHIKSKKNYDRCVEIAKKCKELGVRVAVNSDAHICFAVGDRKIATELLESIDFPEELIANRSLEVFNEFLEARRK